MKQLVRVNCVTCGGQNLIIEVELKKDGTFDDGQCPQCGIVCSGFIVLQDSQPVQNTGSL
jgi:hypothetical protein